MSTTYRFSQKFFDAHAKQRRIYVGEKPLRFSRFIQLGLIAILIISTPVFGAHWEDTIDDRFAAIAKQVPEFGGMYVDGENDTVYVYMRDTRPATVAAAIAEFSAVFGDEFLQQGKIQVLPAKFGFLELKQWHDYMAERMLPGVVMLDIDDAKNRLLVGVENSQVLDLVEQQLAESGIPREAVDLIEVGPIELNASLNDRIRPLLGGLKIIPFSPNPLLPHPPPRFVDPLPCTLGFIATRAGELGFVTNAHCSNRFGAVDNTSYAQPSASLIENLIGRETIDPFFSLRAPVIECHFPGRCPRFQVFERQSDSNFSRILGDGSPMGPRQGFIARPELNLGPDVWDGIRTYRITAEATTPFVGTHVTKVGQATGRTQGVVFRTGVTINIPGGSLPPRFPFDFSLGLTRLRNQVLASYESASGDSGAPVLRTQQGPDPPRNILILDTSLQGIHWGRITTDLFGSVAIFSTIEGVEADLGPLNTCAPEVGPC